MAMNSVTSLLFNLLLISYHIFMFPCVCFIYSAVSTSAIDVGSLIFHCSSS